MQDRLRKAQKNNPAFDITKLKTSETSKLLGRQSKKEAEESDGELDFVGGGKLDIKAQLSKGKLSFAEKFGQEEQIKKSVKGMFLNSGIDLKRKKVD